MTDSSRDVASFFNIAFLFDIIFDIDANTHPLVPTRFRNSVTYPGFHLSYLYYSCFA